MNARKAFPRGARGLSQIPHPSQRAFGSLDGHTRNPTRADIRTILKSIRIENPVSDCRFTTKNPRDSVVYDRFTHREDYAVMEEIAVLAWNGALVAHSLARMTCRNVTLHAIASPKVARRHQQDLVPATVWHEIRITIVPQIRTTGRGVLERDQSKMHRFWVRGHYADYRNGAGLFGNPKLRCVFWIPEHQRGNAELGDVIPEYTLA